MLSLSARWTAYATVTSAAVVLIMVFGVGCASPKGSSAKSAAAAAAPGAGNLTDPTPPPPEFRAMFVATAYNLDWPSRPTLHRRVQKDEINAIVNRAVDLNCNVIILQVRSFGDRIYRDTALSSPYTKEPWSMSLNNGFDPDPKAAPDYDPLKAWINACDDAGLELHAWINPFRVNRLVSIKQDGEDRYLPVVKHEGQLYLKPTSKLVQDYVKAVLDDFFVKYPAVSSAVTPGSLAMPTAAMLLQQGEEGGVDGVIYDHQIPPDDGPGGPGGGAATGPGTSTAPGAGPGSVSSWGEARTDYFIAKWKTLEHVENDSYVPLDTFIKDSADKVKAYEGEFGYSPSRQEKRAMAWLTAGHFNYVIPELYNRNTFVQDLKDWLNANTFVPASGPKPLVVAGLFTTRVQTPPANDEDPWGASEIRFQIADARSTTVPNGEGAKGQAHYSGSALRYPDQAGPGSDDENLGKKLKANEYKEPRLAPASRAPVDNAPDAPTNVRKEQDSNGDWHAKWTPATGGGPSKRKVKRWAVWLHRTTGGPNDWEMLKPISRKTTSIKVDANVDGIRVKAIDRFNRESAYGKW